MILVGLFAINKWEGLSLDIEGYKLGKVYYIMTLVWSAVCWQISHIGAVGLICEVSSFFCNVMNALVLPLIIQALATIVFHDKMNGFGHLELRLVYIFISTKYPDDYKPKATYE